MGRGHGHDHSDDHSHGHEHGDDHDHDHDHDRHPPHTHAHAHLPRPGTTSIGPVTDRCEVAFDARIVHPHGDRADGHRHTHGHAAGHPDARTSDRRKLLFAVTLTGAILIAEVVGGLVSGSLALLSDAGHMLTDLSALALSFLAILFASRPATARRTYGYYRLEILAALVNGIALLLLSGYIVYEAYHRLSAPPEVRTNIMLVIGSVGLAANLLAIWVLHGSHSMNVRGAYLHILSDAASSVAVVGGAVVMYFWHSWIVDPVLGFLIGAMVLVSAYRLIREASDVLLEAVPRDIDLERVRQDVRELGGIEDVHDLHIWSITSGMFALSAHIVVHKDTLALANDELLTRIKELLHRRHRISHSTLQIESTEYEHVAHIH